jgi:hypothetical protein
LIDNEQFVISDLLARLRDLESGDENWRAPERADELALSLQRSQVIKHRLELAKGHGLSAISREARQILGGLTTRRLPKPTYGDLLDVIVAFRSLSAWDDMIHFIERAGELYSRTGVNFARLHPVVQQYGMALNRRCRRDEAELVTLTAIMADHAEDAETLGILGRIYKDMWRDARGKTGADRFLSRSITAYAKGLLANPGEPYPAINLLTLSRAAQGRTALFDAVGKHVYKLFKERQGSGLGDYFDYATAVEFYALFGEWDNAEVMLDQALKRVRARWELETTAENLDIVVKATSLGTPPHPLRALRRRLTYEAARRYDAEGMPLLRRAPIL